MAAMFSPTARNKRPWEFVLVRKPELLTKLSESTPYAGFVKDAPVTIVICYDTSRGRRFKEDSSLCAGSIYLEAVHQGLGTCFVQIADSEGAHGNPEKYVKKLLEIPEKYRVQCLMPVGYPEDSLPGHRDDEFEEARIHEECW